MYNIDIIKLKLRLELLI